MDAYICSTVYSTPEWSYSVTTTTQTKAFRTFPGVLRRCIYLFYSIQYPRVVILRFDFSNTFPGVLRGWIYLFYSIQYPRVVILRNTQTQTKAFRTFPGVLRGCIYLFYSIQYPRVVILRNKQTHKHTHTQTHKANLKESRIYKVESTW